MRELEDSPRRRGEEGAPLPLVPLDARLRRLAQSLVGDEATADDVVQDTWLASLSTRGRDLTRREGWMRLVTWRTARRALRDEAIRRLHQERLEREADAPGPDEPIARVELGRVLRELVDELPRPQAAVVRLRYFEELPLRDVAARLDLPLGTVKSYSHYALRNLRAQLDRRYEDRRAWSFALLAALRAPTSPSSGPVHELPRAGWSASRPVRFAGGWIALACGLGVVLFAVLFGLREPRGTSPEPLEESARRSGLEPRPVDASLARAPASPDVAPAAERRPVVTELEVLVLDAAERPIDGARVFVAGTSAPPHERGRTDVRGRFLWALDEQDVLRPENDDPDAERNSESVALFVHAPGWARTPRRQVTVPRGGSATTEFRLEQRGVELAGRVVGAAGASIEGAEVVFRPHRVLPTRVPAGFAQREASAGAPGARDGSAWTIALRSDREGGFRVPDCAPGSAIVQLRAPGHAVARHVVDLPAGGARAVERTFRLEPASAVRGTVLDAAGEGVADAEVSIVRVDLEEVEAVRTYENGDFELDGVPPGSVHLRARGLVGGTEHVAQAVLQVEPGEDTFWTPQLVPAVFFRARVVDEEGEPRVGWRVLLRLDQTDRPLVEECTTDRDGRVVARFALDEPFSVYVFPPGGSTLVGHEPVHVITEVLPGEDERLILVPSDALVGARLRGRVLSADGVLPPGASLFLIPKDHAYGSSVALDEDGRFDAVRIPPGSYDLCLTSPDAGFGLLASVALEVGVTLELGELPAPGRGRVLVHNAWPEDALVGGMGFVLAFIGPGHAPIPVEMQHAAPRSEYGLLAGTYAIGVYDGDPYGRAVTEAVMIRSFEVVAGEDSAVTLEPGVFELPSYAPALFEPPSDESGPELGR